MNSNWQKYLAPCFDAPNGQEKKSPVMTHPACTFGLSAKITAGCNPDDAAEFGALQNTAENLDGVRALCLLAFADETADDHRQAYELHRDQAHILEMLAINGFDHYDRLQSHLEARNFHYLAACLALGETPDERKFILSDEALAAA